MRRLLSIVLVLSVPFSAVAQEGATQLALKGLDPVALTKGQEVAGDPDHPVDHGRFRYRFATDASRTAFTADPERYAIQFGGGCGAMGPLSGVGDPARWTVHDGRIFIFASDGCRAGFVADPAAHLDAIDAVPSGTLDAAERADRHLADAVEAIGGAERVDGMTSLVLLREGTQEADGKLHRTGAAFLAKDGMLRREVWWGSWHRIDVTHADAGFVYERDADGAGTWDHGAAQRFVMKRSWQRQPLAILRARTRDDFVAFHVGTGTVGDRNVEHVLTSWDGAVATLGIDAEDGQVRSVAYHGRVSNGGRGDVVVTFADFIEVKGLTLPMTWHIRVDGEPRKPLAWTSIGVDEALDPAVFERASVGAARSAKPGINTSFKTEDLNVSRYVRRFEGESREVFVARHRIVKAMGIASGETVADVGSGTGMFLRLLSNAAGDDGKVYAVDIAPKFVAHLEDRAAKEKLGNVEAVLCSDKAVGLPPNSIDVAFICDVYHHFEYPLDSMRSIHAALRPGGRLVVVDFERIPGESRDFILNHVRAGKDVFRAEIEEAGFEFVGEPDVRGLRENYLIQFKKEG